MFDPFSESPLEHARTTGTARGLLELDRVELRGEPQIGFSQSTHTPDERHVMTCPECRYGGVHTIAMSGCSASSIFSRSS